MSYAKVMASLNASSAASGVEVEVKKRAPDGSYIPADDRDFAAWARENARACPTCRVLIYRYAGCDHMRCTRCHTDFSWSQQPGGRDPSGGLFGWGAALDSTQERPLAASVQYATSQRAWAALHAAVGENGRRHRAFAEELRATVIGSLKASVKQGYQRGQRYLTHLEKAEANVRRAREEAAVESAQYARVLRAFKKEHCDRPDGPRKLEASGPEMAVLSAAARRCVEAVREANKLTAEFEGTIAPPTLDTLQQHEEQRLQAIELALTNVVAAARTSAALPVDDLATLDDATRGVCVPTDIVSFSATYAGVGSTADELRPPPFAARISELYAAQCGDADGGCPHFIEVDVLKLCQSWRFSNGLQALVSNGASLQVEAVYTGSRICRHDGVCGRCRNALAVDRDGPQRLQVLLFEKLQQCRFTDPLAEGDVHSLFGQVVFVGVGIGHGAHHHRRLNGFFR